MNTWQDFNSEDLEEYPTKVCIISSENGNNHITFISAKCLHHTHPCVPNDHLYNYTF